MADGESQAESEGLQDLHLLDGLLARRRQDAQCAPGELHEDGRRRSPPEGQGEEGGGAGNTAVAVQNSNPWQPSRSVRFRLRQHFQERS